MTDIRKLVKVSNIIGIISIVLLVYWVFAFMLIEVFGLKVFCENISQTFAMSILGIVALLAGALMLNIMLNLTRIAERGHDTVVKSGRKTIVLLLALFPLLAVLLFGDDWLSTRKKQQMLEQVAQQLVQQHPQQAARLADYRFDVDYVRQAHADLNLLNQVQAGVSNMMVIVPDQIDHTPVYLRFNGHAEAALSAGVDAGDAADRAAAEAVGSGTKTVIYKADYLWRSSAEERDYLQQVFQHGYTGLRFSSFDGRYELFYPYQSNGKTVVFYFSDFQRYGKIGS